VGAGVAGVAVGAVIMGMENDMDMLKLMLNSRSIVGAEEGEMDSKPIPKRLGCSKVSSSLLFMVPRSSRERKPTAFSSRPWILSGRSVRNRRVAACTLAELFHTSRKYCSRINRNSFIAFVFSFLLLLELNELVYDRTALPTNIRLRCY